MSKQRSQKLLDKEIAVLTASSYLNEQEIRELYKGFIHEAPSGKMSKTKFVQFYNDVMGSDVLSDAVVNNVFAVFDKNGDGSIDFSEFVLSAGVKNRTNLDSILDFAFEMLDTSGDGHVSFEEVSNYMDVVKQLSNQPDLKTIPSATMASYIFIEFGVDQDEKLNKQQFIDGCKKSPQLKRLFGHQG